MNKKLIVLFISIFSLLLLVSPENAHATHASAGYITYQYIGPNQWKLELHFYRDCAGTSAPGSATINVSSSCPGGAFTVNLTQVPGTGQPVEQSPCIPPVNTTCTGGSAYGIQEWVYTGNVTLPTGCADWKFSYSLCCRNNAIGTIINPGGANLYIESILNNIAAPTNSSPVFSNIGISQFCNGSPVIWNQFATDADNDSLVYTLVCPQTAAGTSVNFATPRTCASPIAAAPPVVLNAVSGQMTFTPNLAQVAVLAVKVSEYRNGSLIGSVVKDMQVNIVNNCSIVPFDNAWLGFNDNWDDPINWCQGVPTLTTNAVVRSIGGPRYVSPIIKNGVVAQAKSLKISNNDSITIDASNTGSLTMADSLKNNASLIVNGTKYATETFGYGTNAFGGSGQTPFQANRSDVRTQIIYTATELLASQMLPGDEIYALCFHIFRRRSTVPYVDFNMRYYDTNQNSYLVNADAVTTGGPYQVYYNPTESLLGIPSGTSGLHTVLLDAPIIWNGGNILLEICYNFLNPTSGFPPPQPDLMTSTQTPANMVLQHEQTGTNTSVNGCSNLTNGTNVISTITDDRPNITFKFIRSYSKYPINIAGNWQNNGVFRAGNSTVIFNGNSNQNISGTSTTLFNDAVVNKPAGQLSLLTGAIIDSTITLSNGALSLNSNILTVNYSSPLAVNKTNGYFISENAPPAAYGKVKWNIGTTKSTFVVPFGKTTGLNIPLSLTPLTGDFGFVEFSTFKSLVSNTPYPNGVFNIPYTFPVVVDRYWNISRSTSSGITADLKLSYDELIEEAIPSTPNKHIMRWNSGTWDLTAPFVPYLSIAGRREVTRLGTSLISPNWAIANEPTPLPIELILFDGEARDNYNYLWWITATELNTERFEIEKSMDLIDFYNIGYVKAKGFSNTDQYYNLRDNDPKKGRQYYRLKSVDFDGSYEYSKPISIYYGTETSFEVIALAANKTSNKISVEFVYNGTKDLNIVVTDLVGKIIDRQVYSKTEGDNHHLELNLDLSSALYFITFYNDDLKVTKKIAF